MFNFPYQWHGVLLLRKLILPLENVEHQYFSETFLSVSAATFSIKSNIKLAYRYSKNFPFSTSNIKKNWCCQKKAVEIVLYENKLSLIKKTNIKFKYQSILQTLPLLCKLFHSLSDIM